MPKSYEHGKKNCQIINYVRHFFILNEFVDSSESIRIVSILFLVFIFNLLNFWSLEEKLRSLDTFF